MRARKLGQALLTIFQITAVVVCLSLPALAQAPNPAPSPAPASASGKSFSENLAGLAIRAAELLPVIQAEVESPLLSWFKKTRAAANWDEETMRGPAMAIIRKQIINEILQEQSGLKRNVKLR